MKRWIAVLVLLLVPVCFSAFPSDNETIEETERKMEKVMETVQRISYREVFPDVTTPVIMSSLDVNRIVCPGVVGDVVYSKEKGVKVKRVGNNVFVKFVAVRIKRGEKDLRGKEMVEEEEIRYPSKPVDIYVVCNNSVYSIVAFPRKVPPVTVLLSRGKREKVKKNAEEMRRKSFTEFLVDLVKKVYSDRIPETYTVKRLSVTIAMKEGVLRGIREVVVEGTPFVLKEYLFIPRKAGRIEEKDFLRPEITRRPVAVSLDGITFGKGEKIRVFIVEKRG